MAFRRKEQFGPSSRISGLGVLAIVLVVIIVALAAYTFRRWEGQPPEVKFDRDFKALGKNPAVNVTVSDAGTGLDRVTVRLKQKAQDIVLVDETLQQVPSKTYDLGKLLTEKAKLEDGPATFTVSAVDHALLRFFHGNSAEAQRDFTFDVTPPTLEVFSAQHYINQGGSECVLYRVSDDVQVSGVQAGPHFFPGYPVKEDPKVRF